MTGAGLLDEVAAFCGRFIAYPNDYAQVAHTLWIAHAHLMDAWETTPRLASISPEPGSGKTRLQEVTALLVPNPVETANVSPAYLFRRINSEDGLPTILYDEIDALFGGKGQAAEEIRALLNAGHRRGATVGRCVITGKTTATEDSPAFCAVALAGLGFLPDTLMSRSIILRIRRRLPAEYLEPFRRRDAKSIGHALRDRLVIWAASVLEKIRNARPTMPAEITDRAADCWEPLLAVADAAGGHWPETGRVAAVALVVSARETNPSLGIRLLADLRDGFGAERALPTEQILQRLQALPESPWGNLRAKPRAGLSACRSNIAHVSHLSAGLAHASAQANGRKPAGHGEAHSSTGECDARRTSGGRGRQGNEQDPGTAEEQRRGDGQK